MADRPSISVYTNAPHPHRWNITVRRRLIPEDMPIGGACERATRIACYSIRPSSLSLPVNCGFVGSTNTVPSSNNSTGICFWPLICSAFSAAPLLGFDVVVAVVHVVAVQHLLGTTAVAAPLRTVEFDCGCHSSSLSHALHVICSTSWYHTSWRHLSYVASVQQQRRLSAVDGAPFIVPAVGPHAAASRCRRIPARQGGRFLAKSGTCRVHERLEDHTAARIDLV